MIKFNKVYSFFALLALVLASPANAAERHNEETGTAGTVYFFMKMAYPMTTEHMYFMSRVHNIPGLKVYTARIGLSPAEMEAYKEDPSAFVDQAAPVPSSYMPDPKKLQAMAGKIRDFEMLDADDSVTQRYNVTDFPSFLYLTPDGDLYRFPFKAFASEKSERKFWRTLKQNKDNKPQKQMWKNKKWSQ